MSHQNLPWDALTDTQQLCSHQGRRSCAEQNFCLERIFCQRLVQLDRDQQFWWRTTGVPLAILLAKSEYSFQAQWQNLLLYIAYVIPLLGPGPDENGRQKHWKSFMTDHFSPVELSWEWGTEGQKPTVRFSFEPIGNFAGTSKDPFNCHAATRSVNRLQPLIPNCDLRLFEHFRAALLTYASEEADTFDKQHLQDHQSRIFLAFDLGEDATTLKAYFIPIFKAVETQSSTMEIISDGIKALPEYYRSVQNAFDAVLDFVDASTDSLGLQGEIFAIDCVEPQQSRLKIYMRSPATSWLSVRTTMTMNGRLETPAMNRGLEELKLLWQLVLGLESEYPDGQDLPFCRHRTAGMLYYFELRPKKLQPSVKLYIPVRHYGQNDLAIANKLAEYLDSIGKGKLALRYLEAMRSLSTEQSLNSNLGLQTYLGCSLSGHQLKLTSYLAPRVFKP